MIPYVHLGPLELGPFKLQPFGVLVLLGVAAFVLVANRRGRALGLWTDHVVLGSMVVVGGSVVGGHVFAAFFYYPERLAGHWAHLLELTNGQSLFGGLLGGTLGGVIYLLVRRFPLLLFAEPYVYGTVVSLIFGRLGCALTHDHPGRETTFFGAVTGWPDGTTRHDLGLHELGLMLGLAGLLYAIRNRRALPGLQVAVPMILYAIARFALDFLRTVDLRYAGLTPAQYGSILLLAGGVAILIYGQWFRRHLAAALAADPDPVRAPAPDR
jgi:phosphatidylglycerol:prolipoprotein diacylglycerol transferase